MTDVAAVSGARFADSRYVNIVNSLPPGACDLAVFTYSTAVNTFRPAKVVRIAVH